MTTLDVALDVQAELGEGPRWDEKSQRLLFVDIMRGAVHDFDPASGADRVVIIGRPVGVVACTHDDTLIVGAQGGFFKADRTTGHIRLIAAVEETEEDLRLNDGNCDSHGRFWAGSLSMSERPQAGALYRLDSQGAVTCVMRGVTISNGIDWAPDDTRMYYVDTPTGMIEVFDYEPVCGGLSNRRPFAVISAEHGRPDGLTVDADGGVWVALWNGGAVRRYTSEGHLDAVIPVPVSCPTSCAFGGPELEDLYITSARVALSHAERVAQPHAGSLFRCRPGVRGRLANRFGG